MICLILLGWIFDATGSYNAAFVLAGVISICVSLLMSLDLWLIRVEKRRNAESKEAETKALQAEKLTRSVAQYESTV